MPRRNGQDEDEVSYGTTCGIKSVNEYLDKVQTNKGYWMKEHRRVSLRIHFIKLIKVLGTNCKSLSVCS